MSTRTFAVCIVFIILLSLAASSILLPAETSSTDESFPRFADSEPVTLQGQLPKCDLPYKANFYTSRTATFLSYSPSTQIRVLNESGVEIWSGVLQSGEQKSFIWTQGLVPIAACGSNPYAVLIGTPFKGPGNSGVTGGVFVVDEMGLGTSTHFYAYTGGVLDPQTNVHYTHIFAYHDNTSVVLKNNTGQVIWSGLLNRGEYHTEEDLYHYFLELNASKKVALQIAIDRGYFVPSENGLFAGTHFMTWVEWHGPLQIMSYNNDTEVTVKRLDTGGTVWSGILHDWDMITFTDHTWERFYEVLSSKPVTVSSLDPDGSFAQMDYAADRTGTRYGTDFLTTTPVHYISSDYVIFSYSDSTQIRIYNATSRSLVSTYLLDENEFIVLDPTNESGVYTRIRTNKPVTVQIRISWAASAYVPVLAYPMPPTNLWAFLTGSDFENVALFWNLSPDDGAGRANVVRYDIVRGTTYDSSGSSYSPHDSVPAGTTGYIDFGAGDGNRDNYFYIVCAVNNLNISSCTSRQAGKFIRPLALGPNLVSIPLVQYYESIETVLQTVDYNMAWSYDSSSGEWKWHMGFKEYRRGLWNVNHTMGIWVNVTGRSNLTVAGIVPAQTTIHVRSGWNLVSFPSFNTSYSVADLKAELPVERVEGFDPTAPPHFLRVLQDSDVLLAGEGYWVKVSADATWVVSSG